MRELFTAGTRTMPSPFDPVGEAIAGGECVGVFRPEDTFHRRQELRDQVPGGGIPRLAGPCGEVSAGSQDLRVSRPEDPPEYGQQRGEQISRLGRVSRLAGQQNSARHLVRRAPAVLVDNSSPGSFIPVTLRTYG
jgi:hypothetical protein